MTLFRIVLKKSIAKDIRGIPASALKRIKNAIDQLRTNPYPDGHEKVRGYDRTYRIRIGRYRVIYEVEKTIRIITIIRIGHRKNVYKHM